jgi:hypothetical protein
MDTHEEFLRFSAVLSHCYQNAKAHKLGPTVEYGKKAGLLNSHNRLSPLGVLVGNVLILKQA